jgi:hypothetical protein
MKANRTLFFILALGLHVFDVGSPLSAQDRFVPANFSGLRIGEATIADVTKRFGAPTDTYRDNKGITWLYYRDIGPVAGKVEIEAESKSKLSG